MKDVLGEIQNVSEAVLSAEDEEEKMKEFLVLVQGEQTGPFLESTIQTRVSSGEVSRDELCWTAGMAEWQPIHSVIKLPSLPEPPLPPPSANPPSNRGNSILAQVQGFICDFTGLPSLEGFKLSQLFSDVFRRKSRDDVDTYFNCGCQKTTPELAEVSSDWPRPWFYLRMLMFGLVVLLGFCFAFQSPFNPMMLPGIIIAGAFFVPLACVALFFEFNILRNISLYQVLKFIVGGGVLSLIVALRLYATTGIDHTFLGDTSAGIVEETAKALVAVFLIRGTLKYKWILNGLLVGAAVGAGFAGFESAGYILTGLFDAIDKMENLDPFYHVIVMRAVFAPFCHVVWTACVVGALWRVKRDQPFRATMFIHKDFLRIFIFVILLHMLWNSGLLWGIPRNVVLLKGEIFLWLVSVVGSWYLALLLVQQGLIQVRNAKGFSLQASIAAADILTFENSQITVPPPTPQQSIACSASDLQWIILLHLSPLIVVLIPIAGVFLQPNLGEEEGWVLFCIIIPIATVIGPFVFWLLKRAMSPPVDAAGRNVLNFQITWTIGFVLLIVALANGLWFNDATVILPIGYVMTWFVFTILGAVKASRGVTYSFPLTIKTL